jgi:hypothetical protein
VVPDILIPVPPVYVVDPPVPVADICRSFPDLVRVTLDPAETVTSAPSLELSVYGDADPVHDKSVSDDDPPPPLPPPPISMTSMAHDVTSTDAEPDLNRLKS